MSDKTKAELVRENTKLRLENGKYRTIAKAVRKNVFFRLFINFINWLYE